MSKAERREEKRREEKRREEKNGRANSSNPNSLQEMRDATKCKKGPPGLRAPVRDLFRPVHAQVPAVVQRSTGCCTLAARSLCG
jgi:hypothetical protein